MTPPDDAVPGGWAPGHASDASSAPAAAAPWAAGLMTGIGSMPGTDLAESSAIVAGELPLPHLVELPARGAGADMVGRALAICVDLPAEVMPSGWRLTSRPGRESRRAADLRSRDLDAAEQYFSSAPWLKVQVAGPWTLAAEVETPRGNRALTDPGAVRDIAASLAEGMSGYLAELGRRLPGTRLVVQVDEPSLPAVLAGTLRTASGLMTVPAVPGPEAERLLAELVESLPGHPTIAHCCAISVPVSLVRRAGFDAVSLDLTRLPGGAEHLDSIGELVEAGGIICAGVVEPTTATLLRGEARRPDGVGVTDHAVGPRDYKELAAPVVDLWHRLGLPSRTLAQVVVTPTCGLAGSTAPVADLRRARDAARYLADRAEG